MIGNGLPAIPKKVHEKIVNWEYVKLAELRPAGTSEGKCLRLTLISTKTYQ